MASKTTQKLRSALVGAELLSAYRVIPRAALVVVMLMSWNAYNWFMALPEPNTAQAIVLSSIAGLVASAIGLYNKSGETSSARLHQLAEEQSAEARLNAVLNGEEK